MIFTNRGGRLANLGSGIAETLFERVRTMFAKPPHVGTIVENAALSLVFGGVSQIAGVALFILVARKASLDAVGAFALGMTLYQYIALVTNFGWVMWGERRLASGIAQPSEITTVFLLRIGTAVIISAFIAILALQPAVSGSLVARTTVWFAVASLCASISPEWVLRGLQRVGMSWVLSAVLRVLYLGAAWVVLVVRPNTVWLIPIAMAVVNLLFYLPIVWPILRAVDDWPPRLPQWYQAGSLARNSVPLGIAALSVGVFLSLDIPIVGALLGSESVGIYAMGNKIPLALLTLLGFLTSSTYPTIVSMYRNACEYADLMTRSLLRGVIAGLVCLVVWMMVEAHWIMDLLYGRGDHPEVIAIFRVFSATVILMIINTFYGNLVLLARNRDGWYTFVVVSTGALSAAFVFIAARWMGTVGAAWGILLAQAISLAMFHLGARKVLTLDLSWVVLCGLIAIVVLLPVHLLGLRSELSLLLAVLLAVLLITMAARKAANSFRQVAIYPTTE